MSKASRLRDLEQVESRIRLCQGYTQAWAEFFHYFADSFEDRKITAEDEAKFFRIVTDLTRKQARLGFFLKRSCPPSEKFLSILSEAVSLTTLSEMTESQLNKLRHGWHVVFIALNKSLGRLMQMREGLLPADQKAPPPAQAA